MKGNCIFLLCSLLFFVGSFASFYLSHDVPPMLQTLDVAEDLDHHDSSGFPFLNSTPFQVCSWYFPRFDTAEQCEPIVKMAKANLKPSLLALQQRETNESTNGTRASSGTFISASEDKSGALAFIEEKIARATMFPRNHGEGGEVCNIERFLPFKEDCFDSEMGDFLDDADGCYGASCGNAASGGAEGEGGAKGEGDAEGEGGAEEEGGALRQIFGRVTAQTTSLTKPYKAIAVFSFLPSH